MWVEQICLLALQSLDHPNCICTHPIITRKKEKKKERETKEEEPFPKGGLTFKGYYLPYVILSTQELGNKAFSFFIGFES